MQALVDAWPVPIEELVIIGHSMGGLVARSAIYCAALARQKWTRCLSSLVFSARRTTARRWNGRRLRRLRDRDQSVYGAARPPGQGAQRGHQGPALRLCAGRGSGPADSAGTRARRHALPLPLPAGARVSRSPRARRRGRRHRGPACAAMAWCRSRAPSGSIATRALALAIPDDHRFVAYETGHFDLLESPEVYERLARWLTARQAPRP